MKALLTLCLGVILSSYVYAQVDQPSLGPSYADFTFYQLKNGSTSSSPHTTWDLAFTLGTQDIGVLVNEGVGLSFSAPLPQIELYLSTSTDFTSADTVDMTQIYNNEVSWSEGAFNHVKIDSDPFDLGWGTYDPTTHQVNGTRVFIIKLRTGIYKKLKIQSLISGVYSFLYADLDGSNEIAQTLDKAEYAGKTLAYFSLENTAAYDIEPDQWDLVFTRYARPLDDGQGGVIDYTLTGVLHNAGVLVAQADNIDPVDVNYKDFADDYSDTLTVIGHDWKSFQGGWSIVGDRVYFIKTLEEELWKIQFIDFEGSSTGVTTLERSLEADLTSLNDVYENVASYQVFPTITTSSTTLAFEVKSAARVANLQIVNALGQIVQHQKIAINDGLNVKNIALNLPAGQYYIALQIANDLISRPIIIQ